MTTPPNPESDKPGKIRTWWHPLLAGVLRWQLGSNYQVSEEVPVGKKPLQIDFLLLHKTQGDLSELARKLFAGLVDHLNEYTLIELKSPSDTLRAGDFRTLLAYALLYCAQNQETLDPARMTLIVVAPRLSKPFEQEMRLLGVTPRQEQPGVWQLEGGTLGHSVWLLETEELADRNHPVLMLISPRFLRERIQVYDELYQAGYTELVVYMAQQIQQFRSMGKEFAMQHLGAEDEMLQTLQDLLASLPVEERLVGMTLEDRLKGITPEEFERLKQLVQERAKAENNPKPG
jgi:hypothetical protein